MTDPGRSAEELFAEALELPLEQRSGFLDQACSGQPEVRRIVENLLDKNDRLAGFLSQPAYRVGVKTAAEPPRLNVQMGSRLANRYRIEAELGSGGMGVVYRAHDEKLDREVALKILRTGLPSSQEGPDRFRREARALAKLNHVHIAAVHDVIEEQGADLIIMELVAGESMASRLRHGALSIKEATSLALQVAEALEEAHEQGVIHRDLKPANVMITAKGQAKVLDFGLARLLGPVDASQTAPGVVMGTPAYMSPEQAIGQHADARSDLWALGVTYYESLAGEPPFQGENVLAILRAVTDAPPRPLRELRPDAPLLAEQITARALEKDPDLRYQHARDLAADLRRVLRDLEPSRAASHSGLQLDHKRPRTRRFLVTAVVLGLVLVATLIFLLRPAIPPPRVIGTRQITDDRTEKVAPDFDFGQRLITDGTRVYYEVQGSSESILKQVSVEGGEAEVIRVPLQGHAALEIHGTSELLTLGDPVNSTANAGALWHLLLPGGQMQRIGDFQANDASWSRDGQSVYWTRDGKVSVTRLDGTATNAILTVQGYAGNIAFSPDGLRMRYSVTPSGTHTSTIWEAGVDGSHPRPIFSERDGMGSQCCGLWTPDGKYYVFQSDRGGTPSVWAMREKPYWWQKVDTAPVQLTVGPMIAQLPLPSRDGKQIFFVGTEHRGELEMYNTRAKEFATVLPRLSAQDVAYTRDGSRMVYVAEPASTLWLSRGDGSDRRQLTFAPLIAALPSWSPDGKQIAFMGQEPDKKWRIYMVAAEPGSFPEAITHDNGSDADPTWSPDGKSIAYSGLDAQWDPTPHTVDLLNLATHETTAVPGSSDVVGTRWSPDGSYLVAIGGRTGVGPLMLYSFRTQQWTRLVDGPVAYPTWSHDGKCLYYDDASQGYAIDRLCLSDRKPEPVVDLLKAGQMTNGRFGAWFGLTPEDSILSLRDSGLEEIYSLQMDWQ
jgi:eukaryotic-like serine/threonine-protein kinase